MNMRLVGNAIFGAIIMIGVLIMVFLVPSTNSMTNTAIKQQKDTIATVKSCDPMDVPGYFTVTVAENHLSWLDQSALIGNEPLKPGQKIRIVQHNFWYGGGQYPVNSRPSSIWFAVPVADTTIKKPPVETLGTTSNKRGNDR